MDEFLRKLKAGIDARENPDFCIIARTDAMVSYGREEAVRRANKYLEAGADAVFVVGCSTLEEVGMVAREVSGPVVVNVNDISELNRYSQETFRAAWRQAGALSGHAALPLSKAGAGHDEAPL